MININTDKVNNILFFNPRIIQENDFKRRRYENLVKTSDKFEIYPEQLLFQDNERQKISAYKKFRDELYKDIRSSGKFCDGILATYVKESLISCDFILRIESSQTRSKKLYGFATLKIIQGSKSLYIDVICTNIDIKGTGSYIMKLLTNICETVSLESIKLNSATQAVPFYLKSEFECNPLCKMIKMVGGSKTRKNRNSCKSKTRRLY